MEVLGTSIVRDRNVITIPKKATDVLDIKVGDIIGFIHEDGKTFIKKAKIKFEDFR